MNKRKIILTAAMLLALITLLFSLAACTEIVSLEKAEIVCSDENATYEIGKFDYGNYTLILTYSDGSEESLPVTESMLSDYDKLKLKSPGKQTITFKYENKAIEVSVTVTRKQVAEDDDTVVPYLSPVTVKYDGKPHTLSVQGDVPQGATVLYPMGNTFTAAGIYPVTAIVQADGYETTVLNSVLTIERNRYDFSDFAIVADYGTDNDGKALTSFVYDGLTHGVKMVGNYPAELGEPKLQITNIDEKSTSYSDGYTAIDAGHYHVIAVFTGDENNYETDNLTFECYFEISKKPISVDVLNAIRFEDLTVDYDAKPHRIDIGKVELPTGISVGYYTADGKTPFGTRTDVGEYDIICKFQSDNPNLEIINELTAHLSILQVNYINVDLLHIGFLDESTEATFNGQPHSLKVFGLNKNVTVAKYVWNRSDDPLDHVGSTSLTDVLVNARNEAIPYKITAYFNTPSDPNHNPVNPIQAELTVYKGTFFAPEYTFESAVETYSENETFSLPYVATKLPAGMKTELRYVGPSGIGSGVPEVTCQPYDAANPKKNCGVGTYTCILSFQYNPSNYENPPEEYLSDETRTLKILPRVYDAEHIITVKNIRVDYNGIEQLQLCGFNEALPDWVSSEYIALAITEKGEVVFEAENAGSYRYYFRFSYFNGEKLVFAESAKAELKIVGSQVYDRYYSVTYPTSFTYDGVTDCLPTAALSEEVATVLSIQCKYTFAKPGDTEYETVYTGAGDRATLLASSECTESAKRAGSHKFEFTISGENYEPLTVSFVLTVNPKKIEVAHTNWILNNETTTVTYDAADHSAAYSFASEPPAAEQALLNLTPKLLSAKTNGKNPGVDVGEYTYKIVFTPKSSNYYVETEDETYFTYNVVVLPLQVTDTAGEEYCPAGFYYYAPNTQSRYSLWTVSSANVNYTVGSPVFEYVKAYGLKVDENTYTMPQWKSGLDGNKMWYSARSLERFHMGMSAEPETAESVLLSKALSEDVTILVLRPDGTWQTLKGLTKHTYSKDEEIPSEACLAIDASLSGDYLVMMILESENITFNGSRIFAFSITVSPVEVGSKNILNKEPRGGTFNKFDRSAVSLKAEWDIQASFDGAPLFEELAADNWRVNGSAGDGAFLTTRNLLFNPNPFDRAEIEKQNSYILYCDLEGNVQGYGNQTVFPYDPLDASRLMIPGQTYTQAGYYYLFVDLGPNVVIKEDDKQIIPDLHRFVVCIHVQPLNIADGAQFAELKDEDETTYQQSASRLYVTEKDKVTYTYGTAAITGGVDEVSGTSDLAGYPVYTFKTVYNGKSFGLTILPNLPDLLKENLTFDVIFERYYFSGGGAALGTSKTESLSGLSYDGLNGELSALTIGQEDYTPVGLYYVIVTVNGNDMVCNGNLKTFIITVQVDRPDTDADYRYTMGETTYDLRTANAFQKETAQWYSGINLGIGISENNKTAIMNQLGVTKIEATTKEKANEVGSFGATVKITYNTEEYGGLILEGYYTLTVITKKQINLSNLASIGNQTIRQSSSTPNNYAVKMTLMDLIAAEFEKIGVDSSDSSTFALYAFRGTPYTNEYGSCPTDTISEYGTYLFNLSFDFWGEAFLFDNYEVVAGDKFTKSMQGQYPAFTPKTNDYKVKIVVEQSQ